MMASVVAATVLREDLGVDVPLLPEVLVKVFSAERPEEGDDKVFVADDIEPPQTVEVAGNEAVRLVRLVRATKQGEEDRRMFTESFLVPVAEGDAVLLLQFTTPNLDFARQYSELFGQIAQTLQILYPDDPTPLGEVDEMVSPSGEPG